MKLKDVYEICDKECSIILINSSVLNNVFIEVKKESDIEHYKNYKVFSIEAMENYTIYLYVEKESDK